jgi:hypothetical protein
MYLDNQGDPARLALAELAQNCDLEQDAYRACGANGARNCFELLRRALADESQEAFACVFRLYQTQVARWITGHRVFRASGESTPDVFVNEAFVRLFRQLRGARFGAFTSTENVLGYLKACAITALLEHNRKERRTRDHISLVDAIASEQIDPSRGVASGQAWAIVERALPDARDRLLIQQRFKEGLSPAAIAAQDSRSWRDARAVSVALQRCLRRLARCYELVELLE